MINLLEGVPGSGKSYEAVVYHVLPALKSGRKVITNLPLRLDAFAVLFPELVHLIEVRRASEPVLGRWDAEAANRGEQAFVIGEFDEPPRLKLKDGRPYLQPPADARLFGSVWDFYTTWRGDDNIGPLYVIDECHVSFPKTKPRKGVSTPDEVIQWFKISRHFGADVLLMTQRMGALDEDIAGLAEFHVRVRKAAFLGRPDHYVRKVFAGFRGGEISADERKYEGQYFPLYKSHTQGATVIEAQAQDVKPAHLKWQRASRIFMLCGVLYLAWMGFKLFTDDPSKKPATARPSTAMVAIPLGSAAKVASSPATASVPPKSTESTVHQPAPKQPDKGPDPLENRQVHLTGCMVRQKTGERICTLSVSQNGMQIFQVTSVELQAYGFDFKYIGDCAAHITWAGTARAIVCDVPSIGMRVAGVH